MARICIIEDNAQSARLVAKLLHGAGHDVISAETGEEGLTAAFEQPPDLFLVDMGLPDIDGQTVIAMLRQQAELQSVPLVAFTAWPEPIAHSMAQAYGCDGIITKPINTRTFVAQVEAYLKGSAHPNSAPEENEGSVNAASAAEQQRPLVRGYRRPRCYAKRPFRRHPGEYHQRLPHNRPHCRLRD